MFHSIRWRLVSSYILLSVFTVCTVGLLALWSIRRYAQAQEIHEYTANAEAVARLAARYLQREANPVELSQLAKAYSFLGNVRVRILDMQRNVLADSGMPPDTDELMWLIPSFEQSDEQTSERIVKGIIVGFPLESSQPSQPSRLPFIKELPAGTTSIIIRRVYGIWGNRFSFSEALDSEDHLYTPSLTTHARRSGTIITVPVGEESSPIGYVELSAGANLSNEASRTAQRALILASIASLFLACALGLWMGHRLTAPITDLSLTTARMSAGDLSARASSTSKDEIGELARQFNCMAEQLQVTFNQLATERDALRRFIADASHELRTPITALRNFIDLLQTSAEDPNIRKEFLAESQAQVDRLVWITNNLLDLSRMDAGLIALDVADHDLNEMITEVVSSYKHITEDKQIALLVNMPTKPLSLRCDRHRMSICLSNLLNNAIQFTPNGGCIEIGANQLESKTILWIRDSGPGIPSEDLPFIFERFYRGRNATAKGSGLGLSIVKGIVEAHGGNITAANHPNGGALFTITFPLPPPILPNT